MHANSEMKKMYYKLTGKRMESNPFFNSEICKDTIEKPSEDGATISAKINRYGQIMSVTVSLL